MNHHIILKTAQVFLKPKTVLMKFPEQIAFMCRGAQNAEDMEVIHHKLRRHAVFRCSTSRLSPDCHVADDHSNFTFRGDVCGRIIFFVFHMVKTLKETSKLTNMTPTEYDVLRGIKNNNNENVDTKV